MISGRRSRYTVLLPVALLLCTAFGCRIKAGQSSVADSGESGGSAEFSTASEPPGLEEKRAAGPGDAYLAIIDGDWNVRYWGESSDGSPLCYNAGIAAISGDGEYTVSVDAGTRGFKYAETGNADGEFIPKGCKFASIIVKDGTKLFPGMSMEITEIKINGEDVGLKAKNYTSSDDGVEMRSNIYNTWVKDLPEDAHSSEGNVKDDPGYSAAVIDEQVFESGWEKVEVTFTVTGTGN